MSDTAKAQLGFFDSVSIIVGIIVGVGIYETSPLIAASLASPAWVIGAWAIGGALSVAGALCYAELASLYPKTGGDYIYLKNSYGELIAFLFGWSRVIIIRPGSIAAMAFPFATYGLQIWNPFIGTSFESSSEIIVAATAVLILTVINSLRISSGKFAQNLLSTLKVLGLFIICILPLLSSPVATPEQAETTNSFTNNFGLALILILFTYGGWSEIAFVAGEVKEPRKNILKILLSGVLVVTLLYVLVNLSFLYALGHTGMSQSEAVATESVRTALSENAGTFVSILICLSALGAVQGLIFTGARISVALGEDFSPLSFLASWSKSYGGPVLALWAQAALTVLIIFIVGSFFGAVLYTSAVVWFFYSLTGLSVIVLRYSKVTLERPYSVPAYPLTVLVFVCSCVYLTYSAILYDPTGTVISLALTLLGAPLYFLSKKREKTGSSI